MADQLLELLQAATKTGDFTLASGKKSDWYLDCREVTLTPKGALLAARKLAWSILLDREISDPQPTGVVGPIAAACPLVTGLGFQAAAIDWDLKLGYVRKEPKSHGTGRLIEGADLGKDDLVVVLDDVATSGGSLIRACKAVAATGASVLECIVLVDREEGAAEALREWSSQHHAHQQPRIPLRSLYTRGDLIG